MPVVAITAAPTFLSEFPQELFSANSLEDFFFFSYILRDGDKEFYREVVSLKAAPVSSGASVPPVLGWPPRTISRTEETKNPRLKPQLQLTRIRRPKCNKHSRRLDGSSETQTPLLQGSGTWPRSLEA